MSAAPPSASPPPLRSRWRWLWRGLKLAGGLLLILLIFHRPLLHSAIHWLGPRFLKSAGLTGTWKSSGNFYSGLKIDDLALAGDEASPLRSLTLDHLALAYDLRELRERGEGAVVKEITIGKLVAKLDLTRSSQAPKPASPAASARSPLPAVFLPKISIEDVSLELRRADGTLSVEHFALSLDPAAPGRITCQRLAVPGLPAFEHLAGTTLTTVQTLEFRDLMLRPELMLEKLLVDVSQLPQERVPLECRAHQGEATLALQGTVSQWSHDLAVDVQLALAKLSTADLQPWGVAVGDVTWAIPSVTLHAAGPVLNPAALAWEFALPAGTLGLPGIAINDLSIHANAQAGTLNLAALKVVAGANQVAATGTVKLPSSWKEMAQADGKVQFTIAAQELHALAPQVTGVASAKGSVDFSQGALQAAQALVQAESLVVQGLPVASVEALLQMTGQVVHLEHVDVVLNAENKLHATGELSLEKARAWEANWAVDCADLSTIPTEVRGAALWPEAGVVRSEGHAAGSLDGLQRKAWNEMEGKLSLSVSNLQLQAATLESLLVKASSAHGKVDLSQFLLTLDAANHLNAQGTVDLNQPEFPLTAKADVQLPELAKLSPWGEIFHAPAIFQGRMEAAWEATGQLQPMSLAGGGRVEISQVRLANVPEILGLTAQLEQAGPKLSVPSLEATAGPWRVQGQVLLDGAELSIPQLQGWLKDTPLLTLSAALNTQSKDAPCALKLEAKGLDLAKLATGLGQSWPATATVTTSADFHGSLNALEGTWDTQAAKIKLASKYAAALQPGRFAMHAKLSDGQFTTTGELVQPPLEPLAFKAGLPLNLGALMETPALAKELAFNAEVHLPTSRLDFLPKLVPQLRALQGTAALDLVATGTATHPVLKGAAVILAPEANFTSASLPSVKDLAIRLHANETAVTLDEASLVLAGGKLHASGQAGLQDFANPTLDFKAVAEEVLLVRDDTISLRANADLRCQGTLSKAAVTGTVDLVRGRVFQEVEIVPLSLPNQLPPPPPPAILGKATSPSLPPPLGQWNFDIAIKTRDPIRLTGNLARGGAVVDLHLAGPGSKPELTGKVDLKDTWLKLPFSRLNLTQGTVSFTKEAPFDPQIELLGEAVVSDYMITLDATGRAVDPKVRFSSSPPLSEGDIASLLATGATTGKLSGADGEAAGRAIFLLVQSAYRKLFPKLASSLEDAEPPRLSFELSGFGSAPNSKGVAAVYELNAKYKVIGRVGEDGNFRGLLYYLIRFK